MLVVYFILSTTKPAGRTCIFNLLGEEGRRKNFNKTGSEKLKSGKFENFRVNWIFRSAQQASSAERTKNKIFHQHFHLYSTTPAYSFIFTGLEILYRLIESCKVWNRIGNLNSVCFLGGKKSSLCRLACKIWIDSQLASSRADILCAVYK